MWDCVQKTAEAAHDLGIDVLVDEDLTEFFGSSMKKAGFDMNYFPSLNLRDLAGRYFEHAMKVRKSKPWLYQDY